ncbi:MAG: hypothetical protein OXQ90_10885 [Gammaproteobacteria bacterium]|nr:hypothetical protein [Gammaproteobacteria bacterium]
MTDELPIDGASPNEALVVAGQKTKEPRLRKAWRSSSCGELVELIGKLDWDEDFDYKRERVRR